MTAQKKKVEAKRKEKQKREKHKDVLAMRDTNTAEKKKEDTQDITNCHQEERKMNASHQISPRKTDHCSRRSTRWMVRGGTS